MPKTKTEAQERRLRCVYHFIVACCLEHTGLPPTVREIQRACHLSSSSVAHNCVQALVKRDLLVTEGKGRMRTIQVVAAHWKAPPICPQCFKTHASGTPSNEWRGIVSECTASAVSK